MKKLLEIDEEGVEKWFDTNTGLIAEISTDDGRPRKGREVPYEAVKPYKPPKHRRYLNWGDVDSINRLHLYITQNVDRRTLVKKNNLIPIHNTDCGSSFRKGVKPALDMKTYEILEKLIENISYKSHVFIKTDELAGLLGVYKGHIRRELAKLKGLVKIHDSKQGEWIIEVSPAYAFLHSGREIDARQYEAIKSWYSNKLVEA